jgi:hypothetical protein
LLVYILPGNLERIDLYLAPVTSND